MKTALAHRASQHRRTPADAAGVGGEPGMVVAFDEGRHRRGLHGAVAARMIRA